MTPQEAYFSLVPKLSAEDRQALDVIFESAELFRFIQTNSYFSIRREHDKVWLSHPDVIEAEVRTARAQSIARTHRKP